jgi:hypothetical protein
MSRQHVPRLARLDIPGAFHDIIIRGIEKRKIVDDQRDEKCGARIYQPTVSKWEFVRPSNRRKE